MESWWPAYGMPSLIAGTLLGLVWASVSTRRRRRSFEVAGLEPHSQWLWFLVNVASMGSYLTMVSALALMALDDVIAHGAMLFLLATAGLAFCAALLFSRFEQPTQSSQIPAADARQPKPLRKSA